MIISHRHKYVFVELPLTGTTAIGNELRRNYHGSPILKKHSTYSTFLKKATAEERSYFSFSCIRHPMDVVVSHYFKLKTGHFNFEDPQKVRSRSFLNRIVYKKLYLDQLKFIRDEEAEFADYFLKYYRRPYSNWSILSHHDMDSLIRFETLQQDFQSVLRKIGIDQVRELPKSNKTAAREKTFFDYYSAECVPRAKVVFKCFMNEWGYEFPGEWGDADISLADTAAYRAINMFRSFYWTYFKQGR